MGGRIMADPVKEFLEYASYEEVDTGNIIANTTLEQIAEAVVKKQDCILYGPPGTSKTFYIDHLPDVIGDRIAIQKTVQFHSNFSYEDFIEGIVPSEKGEGFKNESGVFFDFCDKAKDTPEDKICLFIIDEINRANVTAVFGEVLNLMEDKGQRKLFTSKRHIEFTIPKNVVIIGTMNTADKTLAKLDFAFRRRFRFLPVFPSGEELHKMVAKEGFSSDLPLSVDEYIDCFEVLNTKILKHQQLGKNLTLGHVLWTRKSNDDGPYTKSDISRIFKETLLPQIENYCGANRDVLASLLGPSLRDKVIYGYKIEDDDIIEYLTSLKNSKVVES